LSIGETFKSLKARKRTALMPFVAAGYPDMASVAATLPALEHAGASLIEIGFPFSDPIADGPTIQAAFTEALAAGLRLKDVFDLVRGVRSQVTIPLVAMVTYSMVYRYGVEKFVADAKSAGFDGLILPDLPPPEADEVCTIVRRGGLDTILLVAPTTSDARRKEIARLSSGFIYYLSVSGITGERDKLPDDVMTNVQALRKLGDTPVCVGFGIHKAEQVAQLAGVADGAIVGSALVKRMREAHAGGPPAVAAAASSYCRELLRLVR
jgi:tryptophan synthase alpha chain